MAGSPRHKALFSRAAGRQVARLVRLVHRTSKVIMDPSDGQEIYAAHHPSIVAVWHGQFMMVAALQPAGVKADAMVGRHGDAEIIGEAMQSFDVGLVRGSGSQGRAFRSERGGVSALRQAMRALKNNRTLVMTADVPPGPARCAGLGIVTLAKHSGRPIVPVAVASSRYKSLNTWSRMTINLPYSTLACVVGRPVWVDNGADGPALEQKRQEVEHALNEATRRAYQLAGVDPTAATPPGAMAPDAPLPSPGVKLALYRSATSLLRAAAPLLLKLRERRGKENPQRVAERLGIARADRPKGLVAWFHAASVGETNAVLPLIDRMLDASRDLAVVLTTGTVTSANLAQARLGDRALHQFVPLDAPQYARRFLDHWRPDLAVFTESEIWPNLILETSKRNIPLALVNGRMSKRSFQRWRRNPGLSLPLFSRFSLVVAQSDPMARRFSELGARNVINAGNLKADAPPPPVDGQKLARLKAHLEGREIFVAASTHDGEEAIVADAHRRLKQRFERLCTVIAPRHPERGPAIAELIKAMGLPVAQRSLGEWPGVNYDVYIADTIGELGLFYALGRVAFIGGSLVGRGGQNPLEAVRLGTVVVTGPSYWNFTEAYGALLARQAVRTVHSAEDLAESVQQLMSDPEEREAMLRRASEALDSLSGALAVTSSAIEALLPANEDLRRAS